MKRIEVGLLVIRLVVGITFLLHGLAKFQNGLVNTSIYFESLGLPGILAYVVSYIELVGGAAMILGVGTQLVSVLFAFVMIGAIFTVKLSAGFMGNSTATGYEFNLLLLAVSVLLAINGSKLFSIDQLLFRDKEKTIHG
ncbi:DoxX family protein [Bacillus sp. Marseille-P3661]|uniref:DoxX family protein n=1 Tax=Bacillus sp. Marseille-P3661 TaxID=1936234 RepID=UPI000C817AC3|nr:DoxX family protein [Bacillus sp. Marseille-P3661]